MRISGVLYASRRFRFRHGYTKALKDKRVDRLGRYGRWNIPYKRREKEIGGEWAEKEGYSLHTEGKSIDPRDSRFKSLYTDTWVAEGDIVQIVKGEHKGKIDRITSVISGLQAVSLSGNNYGGEEKPLPKEFLGQSEEETFKQKTFSYDEIRPVVLIKDEIKTKKEGKDIFKYVVVEKIGLDEPIYDSNRKRVLPRRYIAGQKEITIPWPKIDLNKEDISIHTPEILTTCQSYFIKSSFLPPMPSSVYTEFKDINVPGSEFVKRRRGLDNIEKTLPVEMPLTEEKKIAKEALKKRKEFIDNMEMSLETKHLLADRISKALGLSYIPDDENIVQSVNMKLEAYKKKIEKNINEYKQKKNSQPQVVLSEEKYNRYMKAYERALKEQKEKI